MPEKFDHNSDSRFPLALLYLAIIHCAKGEVDWPLNEFDRYLQVMPPEIIPQWHRDRIKRQLDEWA